MDKSLLVEIRKALIGGDERLLGKIDIEIEKYAPKKDTVTKGRTWWYRYRDDRIVERFQNKESVEDISFAQGTSKEVVKKVLRERLAGTWAIEKL